MPARTRWRMLIISLPSRSATPRMRVWRALKALGAAVLRDGVYLLPDSEAAAQALAAQASEVIGSGGTAQVLVLDQPDLEQERHFRALFDRGGDYTRLTEELHRLRAGLHRRRLAQAVRALRRLRREYETVHATDYFAGPAAEHAGQMLMEVEAALAALKSPGEPRSESSAIRRLDAKAYRGRTWATRERPWVDRLASAWLIRRFIDPKARFRWLKDPKRCPAGALGFDFNGAAFTHVGTRVTFETLLASFGLEGDKGLARIAQLVHYLDVGGVPITDAPGISALLQGARERIRDDDMLLAEAMKVFDNLYHAYSEE
ncbi:MAG: chromate resistance protein [Gammaproteobacteria bacterium]|nr:chromate resistance protein [Gammaproteobacteria bacterium]